MTVVGSISGALLYLCFSVLIGSFILYLVPNSYRPEINVSKNILRLSLIGIAFLSFMPLIQLIVALYKDVGIWITVRAVIFTFVVGKAWIFAFFLSNILIIYITLFDIKKKTTSFIGIVFTILLILSVGWSSHAASLVGLKGIIIHSMHFLAVSIWVGILLVIGYFSISHKKWLNFLRWFTPVAILCFLTTAGTGLYLMTLVVEYKEYTSSWILPYGQALLIKHLLIIPLLVFAFINSFLIRKRLKENQDFNPKPWVKSESIIVLFIFSATAALGQQSPPHEMETAIASEGPSKLFDLLYVGTITRDMKVVISFGFYNASLLILALLFLGLTILSFVKKAPSVLSITMSLLCVLTIYLSLMLSIQ